MLITELDVRLLNPRKQVSDTNGTCEWHASARPRHLRHHALHALVACPNEDIPSSHPCLHDFRTIVRHITEPAMPPKRCMPSNSSLKDARIRRATQKPVTCKTCSPCRQKKIKCSGA